MVVYEAILTWPLPPVSNFLSLTIPSPLRTFILQHTFTECLLCDGLCCKYEGYIYTAVNKILAFVGLTACWCYSFLSHCTVLLSSCYLSVSEIILFILLLVCHHWYSGRRAHWKQEPICILKYPEHLDDAKSNFLNMPWMNIFMAF